MTFRMDQAEKMPNGQWHFRLKISLGKSSRYISLVSANKPGLFLVDGFSTISPDTNLEPFAHDFKIDACCNSRTEAAYLAANSLLAACYGPMLNMDNEIVPDNRPELFRLPGCIGWYR